MPTEDIAVRPSDKASRVTAMAALTLSGNRTITVNELEQYQILTVDPGGAARNLVLPAEAASKGAFLFIANSADAAETITVQDDTPATVITLAQNKRGIVWCDGTAWYGVVGA